MSRPLPSALIVTLFLAGAAGLPACTLQEAPAQAVAPPQAKAEPSAPSEADLAAIRLAKAEAVNRERTFPEDASGSAGYGLQPAQEVPQSAMSPSAAMRLSATMPPPAEMAAPAASSTTRMAMAAPVAEAQERYAEVRANPLTLAAETPVSTFSVDVDTGAYANVRRLLNEGRLPPADAVRVEGLINYFDYAYAPPKDRSQPFALHTELGVTPWNPKTELLAIGIQGWKPADTATRPSNLVFLVDVSGSMQAPDKLPLVKASLKLLAGQLGARDRISLVVYAGRTDVLLEPTPGDQTATIVAALDRLEADGSTNGGSGIQLAYAMAEKAFIKGGNNRVLLATDGDFNVGIQDVDALKAMVEAKRRSGVALSTLGFGTGNYNDALMEGIADVGNGHYSYIDSAREAQRVLVDERAAALETIAADVKIQVEFNPAVVAEYRLIGYENRVLRREDFNNDAIDAGDIGAGHRVTALYEIARVGSGGEKVDALRYGKAVVKPAAGAELAHLKLRWKHPDDGVGGRSRLIEQVIAAAPARPVEAASPAFRLAAAVAGYGQLLRGGDYTGRYALRDAAALAASSGADQASGRTAEFVELARLAAGLSGEQRLAAGPAHGDD